MSEEELRLECAKLAVALGAGAEVVDVARRLYSFVTAPSGDAKGAAEGRS